MVEKFVVIMYNNMVFYPNKECSYERKRFRKEFKRRRN